MKIAIITSNNVPISPNTKKGTEIFVLTLVNALYKQTQDEDVSLTLFASGDSEVPIKIESVSQQASSKNSSITKHNKHIIFELALISKALSMDSEFDIFHANIGDGDIVLPFASFTSKPIIITIHHTLESSYIREYFTLFSHVHNVTFVAISEYQKKLLHPNLNSTLIYNGVDLSDGYNFDAEGGSNLIWAGRAIPVKGPHIAVRLAQRLRKRLKLFAIKKSSYSSWFQQEVIDNISDTDTVTINSQTDREGLIPFLQKSKAFIFPVAYEEAFGLVLIESMACGTPVVAFARGAIPEIIVDGETGFMVNSSDTDIRGNFLTKKTGFEGLCEAVEKIYSLSDSEYRLMREKSRQRIEDYFTSQRMTKQYLKLYRELTTP